MIKKIILRAILFIAVSVVILQFNTAPIKHGIILNKGWKFQIGDSGIWADTNYDDHHWAPINPTQDIHDHFAQLKDGSVFWLRLKYEADSEKSKEAMAFIIQQSVASEIYLNGKKIQSYGELSSPKGHHRAYDPLWSPIAAQLSKDRAQVIAARIAIQPGVSYTTMYETPNPLLKIELLPLEHAIQAYHSISVGASAFSMLIIGICIMLFILHSCFYAYYSSQKANLYFACYAFLFCVGYSIQLLFWNLNHWVDLKFVLGNMSFFFVIVGNLLSYYSLQVFLGGKTDKYFKWLCVIAVLGIFLNAYHYQWWRFSGPAVVLLVQLNITRLAVLAIKASKRGAWIIMTGAIANFVFYAFFLSQGTFTNSSFFDALNTPRNILYLLYSLSLPAAISVFLGLDFAFTNESLKKTLRENKDLADKNMEQQLEKQRLLSEMNRELESKVEQRTEELRHSLDHLKSTQAQLIQSEKMASLGELTAGIAHEIQNPLNFVNNFSDINAELTDDLVSAATIGNLEEVQQLATDIRFNQEKIRDHGQRADAIVKSMLQHSRVSSGQKEATDINSLCDEYLKLAYHGMRAKFKDFNAKLDTEFDPTMQKVNLVGQDISRVLLNLLNNAFYAVYQKWRSGIADYEPSVRIFTKSLGEQIELTVKDNGTGVSDKLKEKIFQPFFTTKPTGQGTGLGLSLSYDIVKAHGGELTVESMEGQGSSFIIKLPFESK